MGQRCVHYTERDNGTRVLYAPNQWNCWKAFSEICFYAGLANAFHKGNTEGNKNHSILFSAASAKICYRDHDYSRTVPELF